MVMHEIWCFSNWCRCRNEQFVALISSELKWVPIQIIINIISFFKLSAFNLRFIAILKVYLNIWELHKGDAKKPVYV